MAIKKILGNIQLKKGAPPVKPTGQYDFTKFFTLDLPTLKREIADLINYHATRSVPTVQAAALALPDTDAYWVDYDLIADGGLEVPQTAFLVRFDIELPLAGAIELRATLNKLRDGTNEDTGSGQNVRLTGPGERYCELIIDRDNRKIQYSSTTDAILKIRSYEVRPWRGTK